MYTNVYEKFVIWLHAISPLFEFKSVMRIIMIFFHFVFFFLEKAAPNTDLARGVSIIRVCPVYDSRHACAAAVPSARPEPYCELFPC